MCDKQGRLKIHTQIKRRLFKGVGVSE